jgi:hypothetical protein
VNEEEILFNKLHDIFKKSILIKKDVTVSECVEPINIYKEKIEELEDLT